MMRLSQRLTIGFIVVCLFVVISGFVGVIYTNAVNEKRDFVAEVTTPAVKLIDDMIIALWKNSNAMRVFSSEYNTAKLDKLRESFDRLNTEFSEAELKIKKLIDDEKVRADIETAIKRHREFNNKAIEMMNTRVNELNARSPEEKSDLKQRKLDLVVELESITEEDVLLLDNVSEYVEQQNVAADLESFRAVRNMRVILVVTTIISMVSAVAIGFLLSRSIVRPINELAKVASSVSAGNFNVEVQSAGNIEELNRLSDIFNQMTKSLKNMVEANPRMRKFLKLRLQTAEHAEFEPEPRNSYLIQEAAARRSYELFLNKVDEGWSGLCVTRTNPLDLKEKYEMEKASVLWLSDVKDPAIATVQDMQTLYKRITEFMSKSMRSIVLIDRIDYLTTRYGFEEVLRWLVKINDQVSVNTAIVMVALDPSTVGQRELALLGKEFKEVPITAVTSVPEELMMILRFISNEKKLGRRTTFKDIGKGFNITAPTTQKKIKELEGRGLIRIIKQGRNKLIDLTKDGAASVPA